MDLEKAGLTLEDVDLGAGDAEADTRLADYFVKTPYVLTALNFRRKLLLGRKGAGKSALFSQLPSLIKALPGAACTLVLKLTPDQYAWDALKTYSETGLTAEQAHGNAWKFTIAIEVAAAFVADESATYQTEVAVKAHERLKNFLQQNYGAVPPTVLTTAKRLLGGVKSFNLTAFGFGTGITMKDQEQPLTPSVIEALLTAIGEVTADRGVVVALDKLDDSWEGSDKSKQLMIGLLKAAKDINDRFSVGAPVKGLAVVVFLRVDIYEGLTFDDKDKHRATEHPLTWTPDLLKQMTQFRLPKDVTVDELFEPGDMRGSISPFNYIVKRTFLRPRESFNFSKSACGARSPVTPGYRRIKSAKRKCVTALGNLKISNRNTDASIRRSTRFWNPFDKGLTGMNPWKNWKSSSRAKVS